MNNSLMVIFPYRLHDTWVFDDSAVGLQQEPFVNGIPEIIDLLVENKNIANAEQGFKLIFSQTPFPGCDLELDWRSEEYGGNWYYCQQYDREGWLCPALFKYFDRAPQKIYCQAEAVK
ncbi:DUF6717 family protein [Myxosarcina sp. GI1]|uniref:DUF6717 family protein n=1 Tax=Myxosarcina sp. GI1 TaxID=1541065 RepID=UPI0005669ADA|nr:DUF6717 family protein [Myxosarcina sp. GI1]